MAAVGSSYAANWRQRVSEAIRSYRDVLEGLVDAREYYYTRPFITPDDRDEGDRGWYVEIPVLWGSF